MSSSQSEQGDTAWQLRLEADGAEHLPGAVAALLPEIEQALAGLPDELAGVRIFGVPQLAAVLSPDGAVGGLAGQYLAGARPARAILFDKSPAVNWSLGWHQDRTIVVRKRAEVAGFGSWSRKRGLLHVEPPFAVLAGMLTLRLHLIPSMMIMDRCWWRLDLIGWGG